MHDKKGGERHATWSDKTRLTHTTEVMLVGIHAMGLSFSLEFFLENDENKYFSRRIPSEMQQVVDLSRCKVHSLK